MSAESVIEEGYGHLAELHEVLAEEIAEYYPSADHVSAQTSPAAVAAKLLPMIHEHLSDMVATEVNALVRQIIGDDANRLARALHDADCGCDDYDEFGDPRYITAVRAVFTLPESDSRSVWPIPGASASPQGGGAS